MDRWLLSSDADTQLDVLDNGVRMTIKSLGTWYNFSTRFDYKDFKRLVGKTLTLSFKLLTPTTKVNQIYAMCHNTENSHYYLEYGLIHEPDFYKDGPILFISKSFTIDQIYSDGYIELGIQMTGNVGDNIEIEWAKLEVGEAATQFIPLPYGEELALCKRYYQHNPSDSWFLFHRSRGGALRCDIPSETMRVTPTLVFPSETVDLFNVQSVWKSVPKSDCSVSLKYASQITISINTDEPSLDNYVTYIAKNIPCFDSEIY